MASWEWSFWGVSTATCWYGKSLHCCRSCPDCHTEGTSGDLLLSLCFFLGGHQSNLAAGMFISTYTGFLVTTSPLSTIPNKWERNDLIFHLCPKANIEFYINAQWQAPAAMATQVAFLVVGGSSTIKVDFSGETWEIFTSLFFNTKVIYCSQC